MAIISTGLLSFRSKFRRPFDTVDLEELPDSCERTGALVLWLSCKGQADFGEMFSDISYFERHSWSTRTSGCSTSRRESKEIWEFSPQLLQGFWYKLKKKNPKIFVMSPTVATKSSLATKPLGRGGTPNPWRKTTLPYCGIRNRKNLVVEEGTILQEKSTTANGPSCMEKPSGFFTILAVCYDRYNQSQWFLQRRKFGQYSETENPRQG